MLGKHLTGRWFDLEQCDFDTDTGDFRLFLGSDRDGPFDDSCVLVTGVTDLVVYDETKVGIYTVNLVEIDRDQILIMCSSALEMVLTIQPGSTIVRDDPTRP